MQARAVKKAFFFFLILWLWQAASQVPLQAAGTSYRMAPAPAWTKQETLVPATQEQMADAREGVIRLLSDQQVRVNGATTERYFHQVQQIVSQPGIEHASQLQLEFDPTYQQLVIHRIQLKRGAQTINALKPNEIKLVQQESDLEERLFNGTLSALVILNDVRVGDIIEYDYSVNGENPILGGRFADVSYLIESEPVAKLRYRLLWPAARQLKHAVRNLKIEPAVQPQGEFTEYAWERAAVAAPDLTVDTDALSNSLPLLHLSEFQSWQEVVAWALPLYQQPANLSPALRQQVETWRQATSDREQQLLKALRFVQDEIRYLGIEMGPHSHLPHAPALVLERRYGDCKDKALLLCTLLNALGIAAQPSLVNTELYEQVGELPPSPYAFDHVIVRTQLNGHEFWFDATSSLERGSLAQHVNPSFGNGLPIQKDVTALANIPVTASIAPLKTVRESYVLGEDNSAALEVTTVYRGPDADAMRSFLATSSLKDVAQDHLRDYTESDRSITAEGKPEISDDQQKNELVVKERYQVGRFWKDGKRQLTAKFISQELPWVKINDEDDKAPEKRVRLTFPLDVEHIIEINGAALPDRADTINHEALALQWEHKQTANVARLRYRLRTLQPAIKNGAARQLSQVIEQMEDATKVQISSSGNFARAINEQTRTVGLLGLLLMPILAWFAVKWMQFRNRGTETAQSMVAESTTTPGTSPASAIPLAQPEALPDALSQLRCQCDASYPTENWPHWMMLYDGRRICAVQLRCATCQQQRDAYFAMPEQTANRAAAAAATASEEGA